MTYQPCDTGYHVDCLEREGILLGEAAARAGLTAPVPSCPGWQVRDLLAHTGYVHRWAAGFAGQRLTSPDDGLSEAEVLRQAPSGDAVLAWYREGHAALVHTLREAAPDLVCWTFLPAPSPLAFWARRQAHETAIHRVDAELAAAGGGLGAVTPHPIRLAADGVDELLTGFLARNMRAGRWRGRPGVLAVHAEDAAGGRASWDGTAGQAGWLVRTGPGEAGVSRGTGPADCTVTAPAASLYLALWNRAPADDLLVEGDPAFLADLRSGLRVRWS